MSATERLEEKRERRRQRRRAKEEEQQLAVDEGDDEDEERGLTAPKGYATPGRRNQIDEEVERGNFLTRPIYRVIDYFAGVRSEVQKVVWPTREEVRRLLIVVLITVIVASIALGLVGFIYNEVIRLGITTPAIMIGMFAVISVAAFVLMRRGGSQRVSY